MQPGVPVCRAVSPSAPAELGWLLNLLVQTAAYARPAIAELEDSLLPGLAALRDPVGAQFHHLWVDSEPGCPELIPLAHHADCLLDPEPDRFLQWLGTTANHAGPSYELLTEDPSARVIVQQRVDRICREGALRLRYGKVLERLWHVAGRRWRREGLRTSTSACETWRKRIAQGGHIEDLVAPRHPLTRVEQLGWDDLWDQRPTFVVSPLYFCMSGGQVTDLGEYVHVAVAASDLLPIRRVRDAMFVADRLRVLAEPTRVHILIQLMSAPSGVMDLARVLRMSQPTVSGHIKVLREAGLIQQRKLSARSVYVASRKRVERLLEDARGTLARWD